MTLHNGQVKLEGKRSPSRLRPSEPEPIIALLRVTRSGDHGFISGSTSGAATLEVDTVVLSRHLIPVLLFFLSPPTMQSDKIILYDIPGYAAEDRAWVSVPHVDHPVLYTYSNRFRVQIHGRLGANLSAYSRVSFDPMRLLALC